jgi:transposase InsO family protein
LEDHGQVPAALQKEVHALVEQTRERSGWSAKQTLVALGVARRTYYRWLKEEAWARALPEPAPKPVQVYEALPEEKEAVIAYALKHPALRHRELAWRMVDEDVVCLSASTVYRILKEANLVHPWRRRSKRRREEEEKATRPNQIWATDLMYVQVAAATYFFVSFLDEYSRYVVHQELLLGMDGVTVSLAAQKAIDTLPKGADGLPVEKPLIRSDNGSGYVSKEFKIVLKENGLDHQRIKPHCPEENGVIERSNRTIREGLEGEELTNLVQAQAVMTRIIKRYNEERLHSALGYLRPMDYYRGDPTTKQQERRLKMAQARHRRREKNLALEQGTLPYTAEEPVANP